MPRCSSEVSAFWVLISLFWITNVPSCCSWKATSKEHLLMLGLRLDNKLSVATELLFFLHYSRHIALTSLRRNSVFHLPFIVLAQVLHSCRHISKISPEPLRQTFAAPGIPSRSKHVCDASLSLAMPGIVQSYDVHLDFTNDLRDPVTVQLLRDYGNTTAVILLHPAESVTLVLESGSAYRYAVKMRTKVANVTARSWRDIDCRVSQLFAGGTPAPANTGSYHSAAGVVVDRVWRDNRFCVWNEP